MLCLAMFQNEAMNEVLEANREEAKRIADLLQTCRGTHSFTRQLRALLNRVEGFIEHVGVSQVISACR